MIIVTGHIRVRETDTVRFATKIAVHCATVRALDGCLHYAIAADMGDPGLWWISERWTDAAAQAVHMGSDTMAQFNVLMNSMRMSEGRLEAFETDDPGKWVIRV